MNARHAIAASLLLVGLGLGVAAGLAALPLFAVGVLNDTEPVIIAFFAAGGVCWLGLLLRPAPAPLAHPLALAPLALGLWSLLTAPWALFPVTTILGPPQSGEGALWSLCAAGAAAAALALRDHPRLWRGLLLWCAVIAAAQALLSIGNNPHLRHLGLPIEAGALYGYNDYLAYFVPALAALAASHSCARGLAAGLWASAAAALLIAQNGAAIGFSLVLLPAALLLARRAPAAALSPGVHRRWRRMAAAATLLPPLALYGAIHHSELLAAVESLRSRQVLHGVLTASLWDAPWAWLHGHGWGHFADYLARNLDAAGVRLVDTDWRDVAIDQFHSHHRLLEALFAGGLPAAVLSALTLLLIPLCAAPQRLWSATAFALFVAALDGLWFQTPGTVFALALAGIALTRADCAPPRHARLFTRPAVASVITAALALTLLAGAGAAYDSAQRMAALAQRLEAPDARLTAPPPTRAAPVALTRLVARLADAATPPSAAQRAWLRQLDAGDSLPLHIALINVYARLALRPASPAEALTEGEAAHWRRLTLETLDLAPARLDLAAIHLNWLIAQHATQQMTPLLARMAARAPQHPVTLWFEGIRGLDSPLAQTRQQALAALRQSLARGVERYMAVDAQLKRLLAD
ncbi:hypothetical protein [Magnetofaba australis]|uniref:Putative O-antigen polymerase n=1 Tax=Magnetofaba australis IT-1 TaxID=1434232 RepID=A0A1Y2K2N5_9PROT|nr:hypothetical protein [Magnetofaba australis]OSM01917.1 putative O-antigen polymerase [Magnetofaba australis IT-1]